MKTRRHPSRHSRTDPIRSLHSEYNIGSAHTPCAALVQSLNVFCSSLEKPPQYLIDRVRKRIRPSSARMGAGASPSRTGLLRVSSLPSPSTVKTAEINDSDCLKDGLNPTRALMRIFTRARSTLSTSQTGNRDRPDYSPSSVATDEAGYPAVLGAYEYLP